MGIYSPFIVSLVLAILNFQLGESTDRCMRWVNSFDFKIGRAATKFDEVEVNTVGEGRVICQANPACMSISCGRTVANANVFQCAMFTYSSTELVVLDYKVAAVGFTVSECITEIYCSCCVIGDPIIDMADGLRKKLTTNGEFRFVEAGYNIDPTCGVISSVTTAVTNPLQPDRSRVTQIVVNVGSFVIELDSTALADELPQLKIGGVVVPAPYTAAIDPAISIVEYRGMITISVPDCNVRVTFTDQKHSQVCLDLEFGRYRKYYNKKASTQLCGKCAKNPYKKRKKNAAHNLENAQIF